MSLRARLLLGMALVASVLGITAVSIIRSTESNLVDQVDQQLERAIPRDALARAPRTRGPDNATAPASFLYLATVDPDTGEVTTLSLPNASADSPTAPDIDADELATHAEGTPFTLSAKDSDLRYRARTNTVGDQGQTIVYALPLADVDDAIARLRAIVAVAMVAILATLGVVTFWVLRLGVRPLRQMATTARVISQGDLGQRIAPATAGTEAGDLSDAFNHMLDQIQGAFGERTRSEQRLRQFVADASHELRTPVTTIRGYAELYRLGGLDDEVARSEAMRRTEQEATRMGQLVADLLDLARLDQGRPLRHDPVDLAAIVRDSAADAHAVDPTRPISTEAPNPVVVDGDEAALRQVVANLVTNARVHTPEDTALRLSARTEGDHAVIQVSDEGPGMSADDAARAFERFYRADPARTRSNGGSGLGLSIVESLVAAHRGSAAIDTAPSAGTTVTVRLPLATEAAGTAAGVP